MNVPRVLGKRRFDVVVRGADAVGLLVPCDARRALGRAARVRAAVLVRRRPRRQHHGPLAAARAQRREVRGAVEHVGDRDFLRDRVVRVLFEGGDGVVDHLGAVRRGEHDQGNPGGGGRRVASSSVITMVAVMVLAVSSILCDCLAAGDDGAPPRGVRPGPSHVHVEQEQGHAHDGSQALNGLPPPHR